MHFICTYLMFVLLCILARNMPQCTRKNGKIWNYHVDVREFSKKQSFTYIIKIYVPKSENLVLKTVFYLHTALWADSLHKGVRKVKP